MKITVLWLAGLLLAAALGMEIYTRLPSRAESTELNLSPDTTYLVLLLHGTLGRDEPLLIEVADQFERDSGSEPGIEVVHHVWSPWSDNRLRAGVNGRKLGRELGERLASVENLQHLRLIAHSAGSYWLNPICEAYKANAENPARIEVTYLDGMGIAGAWDYFYGYHHYGECADYAAAIFSSDDPVPGTNAALEHAYNTDVTNAARRAEVDVIGHHWPIQYFLENLSREEMTPGLRDHARRPRRVTIVAPLSPDGVRHQLSKAHSEPIALSSAKIGREKKRP